MVVCTGFRNPALTAKLSSTIDVISGGRFELGIGAGWKEEEWRAYGYGFPTLGERMAALGDHLEVIRAMFGPGRASYEGRFAHVRRAINVPKGLQEPRIPIIVGGNGERVIAGYAIRYADELNWVFLSPDEGAERLVSSGGCEAEGRDPATPGSRSTRETRRCATTGRLASTSSPGSSSRPGPIICFARWDPTSKDRALRRGLPDGRHRARRVARASPTEGSSASGPDPPARAPIRPIRRTGA
jgi:alkanesulfonate monooxygenase SsuD/methylene tetrahydromethanopterin reductase-like flavin-dependent oxidoreductase (luciferase family)